jgi:phosphatidylserine/phosphatidylglycerophosphate/cardiolipin synthase-like enzyme
VDVRIILSQYEATGSWLEKLQSAGVDASKYVKIQTGVHNKGFIVDGTVVAVGSQNWSGDGVERNRDASLIIYHAGAANYFEGIFLHDWNTLAKQHLVKGA